MSGHYNLKSIFTTLLDRQPPNSDELKVEDSGIANLTIFLTQTEAEFRVLVKSPADKNALDGLASNLLRVSCDYY